jgi:hypothetical protein
MDTLLSAQRVIAGRGRLDERSYGMGELLFPFGVEPSGPAWLHSDCWEDWYADPRDQAIVALAMMGIIEPRPPREQQPGW